MKRENNNYAPIAMFVYNRVYHTKKTLSALMNNTLASNTKLFIFADAAKHNNAEHAVKEVREYLAQYKKTQNNAFSEIHIIERAQNFGLAKNITQGINEVVQTHGRVIVIEDDIYTSKYALEYFNAALDRYEEEKKVWHIAGWNDLLDITLQDNNDTFLWKNMDCWGWATWRDRWNHFDMNLDPHGLFDSFTKKDLHKISFEGAETLRTELIHIVKKKPLHSWAIYWYGTIFTHGGLCLSPQESLVRNIGNDYSGVHCSNQIGLIDQAISDKKTWNFPRKIQENKHAYTQIKKYLLYLRDNAHAMEDSLKYYERHIKATLYEERPLPQISDFASHTISLKAKIIRLIKSIILKHRPFYILSLVREKALLNESRFLEQERKINTLYTWLKTSANNNPIQKYVDKSMQVIDYANITPNEANVLLTFMETHKPKKVLELGSGMSTLMLAQAIKSYKSHMISIDYNKPRRDAVTNALLHNTLHTHTQVISSQLIFHEINSMKILNLDFDDAHNLLAKKYKSIDLLIIDGEIEGLQDYAGYSTLILLSQFIGSKTTVCVRNTPKIQEYISLWKKYFTEHTLPLPKFILL